MPVGLDELVLLVPGPLFEAARQFDTNTASRIRFGTVRPCGRCLTFVTVMVTVAA